MKNKISLKNLIVLQHDQNEDLEIIEEYLLFHKFLIKKIRLYLNEEIPKNIDKYDLMISLGGPMDTWMEKEHPWLIKEKKVIKKFVITLEKPFLGICLGCQILGEVLGAKVVKSKKKEIGFLDVSINKDKYFDKNFIDFPNIFKVFQWHSYEVVSLLNPKIKIIASSKSTKNQVFKYKNHAYGIQFHFELKENTIKNWCKNKEFKKIIDKIFGENSVNLINEKYKDELMTMNRLCKKFLEKFLSDNKLI
ncbi:MAG: glutamine amidotransferase [Rickettsiales bacterium]|nr:glutamine amidotransferase [Rickettsiales bacterium]